MLSVRALRTTALRGAPLRAAAAPARGYATTVAEEAAEIDPKLFDRKVDMSVIEKGKGFYVNYKRIEDNLKIVRER